jgi:hypothetical protein
MSNQTNVKEVIYKSHDGNGWGHKRVTFLDGQAVVECRDISGSGNSQLTFFEYTFDNERYYAINIDEDNSGIDAYISLEGEGLSEWEYDRQEAGQWDVREERATRITMYRVI